MFPPYSHRSIAPQVTWTQKSRQFRPEPAHFVPTEPLTKAEFPRVNLKTENVTDSEEFSCWASHFSAGILCVLQGKMVQRSAKRPAVRACWQFSDALYKQNAPISGSEISGKAPAGQTCPCRAQPGNRSPLHIHSQQKRCGNTGLLTCVGERASLLRPHPAFSQVFPAMADFRPGGLMTASVWPHAHSTVSCRHNACFLAYPAQMGFAESACITVSISLYKETHLEIISPDEKGQPFSTVSVLSLSYPNGGHFASCFLCAACICLQKRNGPWAVPFFGYSLSRMNSTLRSGAYASLRTNSFSAQPVRSNPFGTVQ